MVNIIGGDRGGGKEEGWEGMVMGHTIFLVECSWQLSSGLIMMRKLITHSSGRFYSYPLLSHIFTKGGKEIGEGILEQS